MRLAIHLLGREVIAIDLNRTTAEHDDEPEVEPGPPFGFSGSAVLHAERADSEWIPHEGGG